MFVVRDETWELILNNERAGIHDTIDTEKALLGKSGARKLMQRTQTLSAPFSDQCRGEGEDVGVDILP
jgi:hypothetical protein